MNYYFREFHKAAVPGYPTEPPEWPRELSGNFAGRREPSAGRLRDELGHPRGSGHPYHLWGDLRDASRLALGHSAGSQGQYDGYSRSSRPPRRGCRHGCAARGKGAEHAWGPTAQYGRGRRPGRLRCNGALSGPLRLHCGHGASCAGHDHQERVLRGRRLRSVLRDT